MLDKQLPRDVEAERSVLGAILLDNDSFYPAAETLRSDDFAVDSHRRIFSTMVRMERDHEAMDLVTLSAAMGEGLEAVGGAAYIASLSDGLPRTTNVEHYARLVKEKATLRNLILLSDNVLNAALDRSAKPEELLGRAEGLLTAIREDQAQEQGAKRLSEAVTETLPSLERSFRGLILGTPTGYGDLDRLISGWIPGEYVVLAARPSVGKTALALEFVLRQASFGNASAIYSLEMSRPSLVLRLACTLGRVNSHRLRSGFLDQEERERMTATLEKLREYPVWIDDRPLLRAEELRWRVRAMAKRYNLKLLVVDYLQLVRAEAENRTQEVSRVSLELKAAAKELGRVSGGTLLAVSQLSRIGPKEVPGLHHLRESGQLEQDTDVVMFIHRDRKDKSDKELGDAAPRRKSLIVAKQRNGPTGEVAMVYLPEWMAFETPEPGEEDE